MANASSPASAAGEELFDPIQQHAAELRRDLRPGDDHPQRLEGGSALPGEVGP